MINCKCIFTILVSPNPEVVAAVDGIITDALGGMLFDFSCVLIL